MATNDDLEERFQAAAKYVEGLASRGAKPSIADQLTLYGLYKQATCGPNTTPKPAFWNAVARAKWQSWTTLGSTSKEEAMALYIEQVRGLAAQQPAVHDKKQLLDVAPANGQLSHETVGTTEEEAVAPQPLPATPAQTDHSANAAELSAIVEVDPIKALEDDEEESLGDEEAAVMLQLQQKLLEELEQLRTDMYSESLRLLQLEASAGLLASPTTPNDNHQEGGRTAAMDNGGIEPPNVAKPASLHQIYELRSELKTMLHQLEARISVAQAKRTLFTEMLTRRLDALEEQHATSLKKLDAVLEATSGLSSPPPSSSHGWWRGGVVAAVTVSLVFIAARQRWTKKLVASVRSWLPL